MGQFTAGRCVGLAADRLTGPPPVEHPEGTRGYADEALPALSTRCDPFPGVSGKGPTRLCERLRRWKGTGELELLDAAVAHVYHVVAAARVDREARPVTGSRLVANRAASPCRPSRS